jgi:hypothetical protein
MNLYKAIIACITAAYKLYKEYRAMTEETTPTPVIESMISTVAVDTVLAQIEATIATQQANLTALNSIKEKLAQFTAQEKTILQSIFHAPPHA